ncbi:MAG: hydroxyacylglutathione hydrolase [Gammaproteobacteria bacterium]
MLHIEPVRAFNDNYLWVFHEPGSREACVVDPGDAVPVLDWLDRSGMTLHAILVTHHHGDHIGGIDTLLAHHRVPVYGPATPRIPQVNHAVADGDCITVLNHEFRVLAVPGHTLEHIAYVSTARVTPAGPALFCGDTLFAAGCGRMFEGTPPMMHASLRKLAGLAPDTQVYCAHEYTLSNLRFAAAVMPDNPDVQARIESDSKKRERGEPTVPSNIGLELRTNPFLRSAEPAIIAAAQRQQPGSANDPATVFGVLRRWKDGF